MKRIILTALLCFSLGSGLMPAGLAQEPLDGPKRIFRDDLLDNLVGTWALTRTIHHKEAQNTVEAEWVLNHQFLRLHMKDIASPSTYEAMVFIGYDNAGERYVAHWIDVFGGRFSETLGYGKRDGDSIQLVFEYPDGPFHNKLTWNAAGKTWTFVMTSKDASGKWTPFATDLLRRAK